LRGTLGFAAGGALLGGVTWSIMNLIDRGMARRLDAVPPTFTTSFKNASAGIAITAIIGGSVGAIAFAATPQC